MALKAILAALRRVQPIDRHWLDQVIDKRPDVIVDQIWIDDGTFYDVGLQFCFLIEPGHTWDEWLNPPTWEQVN